MSVIFLTILAFLGIGALIAWAAQFEVVQDGCYCLTMLFMLVALGALAVGIAIFGFGCMALAL